jgi:hypothetical protein
MMIDAENQVRSSISPYFPNISVLRHAAGIFRYSSCTRILAVNKEDVLRMGGKTHFTSTCREIRKHEWDGDHGMSVQ